MKQQGRLIIGMLLCSLLCGCVSSIWTGANLVYERHTLYKKLSDYRLAANVSRALYHDRRFKRPDCSIELAVFNQDILLTGYVPDQALLNEVQKRIEHTGHYRRFFNQLSLYKPVGNLLEDSWITAKIRSQMIADDTINPEAFKVVTTDGCVYLMGDVQPEQAKKVIEIARKSSGVRKVIKILKYYIYQDKLVA